MFSINRYDPDSIQTNQTTQSSTQDPLARLNARLKAKTKTKSELTEKPTETSIEQNLSEPGYQLEKDDNFKDSKLPNQVIKPIPTHLTEQEQEQDQEQDVIEEDDLSSKPLTRKHKARIGLGLTGANAIPLKFLNEKPKEKTKSKKKYLKRKKLRLQARKKLEKTKTKKDQTESVVDTLEVVSNKDGKASNCDDESDDDENNDSESDTKSDITSQKNENVSSKPTFPEKEPKEKSKQPSPEVPSKPSKRPKNLDKTLETISQKKRKLESSNPPDLTTEVIVKEDLPTQPGVLPRFPAPTRPSLPDSQLLARLAMGLTHNSDTNGTLNEGQSLLLVDHETRLDLDQIQIRGDEKDTQNDQLALNQSTINRLKETGIESLLPVQISVFSALIGKLRKTKITPAPVLYPVNHPPSDICINAPTGSGKTLSYIVPIVETLSTRTVVRLRALIVLPTRDLVLQVKQTFESISKGTGLKLAIVTGQHSFSQEQSLLSGNVPFNTSSECKVDVVIATPGRLIDHLNQTPGFSLSHLCFLILDEADQLLSKDQAWIYQILKYKSKKLPAKEVLGYDDDDDDEIISRQDQIHGSKNDRCSKLKKFIDTNECVEIHSDWRPLLKLEDPCKARPFRILLFSATLKRDPTKLTHLGLRNPLFIKVQNPSIEVMDNFSGYSLPTNLQQHLIVTTPQLKPLVLFHLIKSKEIKNALVFCKSVEGATRLVNLYQLMRKGWMGQTGSDGDTKTMNADTKTTKVDTDGLGTAALFSSDLKPIDRKRILSEFHNGSINLLICSDVIARGLDLPTIENVINYDTPVNIKKYIHRIGRTARAGKFGQAWSLVEFQEAKFLKESIKTSLGLECLEKIKKVRFKRNDMEYLLPVYEAALLELGKMFGTTSSMAD
ncbi:P-loop containing nucleoside triphosphate hydrolase protein [Melampsora americana]|nr:P-loop containing nucleoside triphosphate hydrolase protein [Melampsora americana]